MTEPRETSVKSDVDLKPYNTFNISAKAHHFAAVKSVDQLKKILRSGDFENERLLVLGGGSNVLFSSDFEGLVLHIEIKGKEVVKEDPEYVWLKVGAGENWHQTVRYSVEQGWGGIENLSLIPGTAGAAPIQNIGAYGVELKDVFEELEAVNIETGESRCFNKDECRFGYRDSIFKNEYKGKYIITGIVLKLSKKPKINTTYGAIRQKLEEHGVGNPSIRDISDIVIDIRNNKLPNPDKIGNAGSFFKNPIIEVKAFENIKENHPEIPGYPMKDDKIKVPAGWLIEQTGWKGKVVGHTGTYKQQALVIVNHGGATGEEILKLSESIKKSVKERFGIDLMTEVNII